MINPNQMNDNATIMVVLESSYLCAFRVLIHSLDQTKSLSGLPITVLTSDTEVLNDPFTNAVSTKIHYLGSEVLSLYKGMSNAKVKESVRMAEIPKYTYLKFNVFRDFGYDTIIFLDVDMIAINNLGSFLHKSVGFPISVTPLVAGKLYARQLGVKGASLSRTDLDHQNIAVERFLDFSKITLPGNAAFNSGVFVARKPILNEATFRGLLVEARESAGGYEQLITRDFFVKKNITINHLPNMLNVTRLTLEHIGIENYKNIKNQFGFVHFTGKKPWETPIEERNWIDDLWFAAFDKANEWVNSRFNDNNRVERLSYFGGYSLPKAVRFEAAGILFVDSDEPRGHSVLASRGVTQPWVSWLWREISAFENVKRCADIGANYGEVSLGSAYRDDQELHLFEANYKLIPYLKSSIGAHPKRLGITLHHLAVSDTRTRLRFAIDTKWSGTSTLATDAALAGPDAIDVASRYEIVDVQAAPISDIMPPTANGAIVAKIDVEGAELAALKGFRETLIAAGDYAIILELNPHFIGRDEAVFSNYLNDIFQYGKIYVKGKTKLKLLSTVEEASLFLTKKKKHDIVLVGGDEMALRVQALRYPRWMQRTPASSPTRPADA